MCQWPSIDFFSGSVGGRRETALFFSAQCRWRRSRAAFLSRAMICYFCRLPWEGTRHAQVWP